MIITILLNGHMARLLCMHGTVDTICEDEYYNWMVR